VYSIGVHIAGIFYAEPIFVERPRPPQQGLVAPVGPVRLDNVIYVVYRPIDNSHELSFGRLVPMIHNVVELDEAVHLRGGNCHAVSKELIGVPLRDSRGSMPSDGNVRNNHLHFRRSQLPSEAVLRHLHDALRQPWSAPTTSRRGLFDAPYLLWIDAE
jgi:hypothetical protein